MCKCLVSFGILKRKLNLELSGLMCDQSHLKLSELHFLICKNGMPAAMLPPHGCHKKQVWTARYTQQHLDTKKC